MEKGYGKGIWDMGYGKEIYGSNFLPHSIGRGHGLVDMIPDSQMDIHGSNLSESNYSC